MATETTAAPAPVSGRGKGFVTREMNGATFLTLEHIAHMALVIIVPTLLFAGVISALSMWAGIPGLSAWGMGGTELASLATKALEATMSIGLVAALLVLAPALVALDRRTRSEWHKRPSYAGRLAYKVPVYIAIGVLGVILVSLLVEMLYVVLASLAFIGVPNAPIGSMYLDSFLPALIGFAIFAAAKWYVFKLAKGMDNGKMFSLTTAGLSAVVVLALFITTLVVMHNGNNSFAPNSAGPSSGSGGNYYDDTYNSKSYQDFLNQLSH